MATSQPFSNHSSCINRCGPKLYTHLHSILLTFTQRTKGEAMLDILKFIADHNLSTVLLALGFLFTVSVLFTDLPKLVPRPEARRKVVAIGSVMMVIGALIATTVSHHKIVLMILLDDHDGLYGHPDTNSQYL